MGLIETAFSRNQDMIFKILDNHYRVVIEAFGTRMLKQFTKEDSQFEAIYREFAREHTGKNIVGINQTTRKHIAKIVTINLAENLGVAQIAKKIREESDSRFTRLRSATIARTETHNASSFANHRIAQSMNIPDQQKQWVATLDSRSRDAHLAMNGKTVPIDEDFIVDGRPMGYPSDPRGGASNVINCRCVVIYTSPEDVVTDDTTLTPKPRQARTTTQAVSLDKLLSSPMDKTFTHETFKVGSKAVMLRNLNDRAKSTKRDYEDFFEDDNFINNYGTIYNQPYASQKLFDNSWVNDNVELTPTALAIVEQGMKELDELAKRFKVPRLNGIVVGKQSYGGAMGDGQLFLNATLVNKRANTRVARPVTLTQEEQRRYNATVKEIEEIRIELRDHEKKMPKIEMDEFGKLMITDKYRKWETKDNEIRERLRNANGSIEDLSDKRGFIGYRTSKHKLGKQKDNAPKPQVADEYFDNGVDRIRNLMYHEFGHHIHQTVGINKAVRRKGIKKQKGKDNLSYGYVDKNDKWASTVEPELGDLFPDLPYSNIPSDYAVTNEYEWFAENFSLYFMDRKDLVDPKAITLIERIMRNQNAP